jgi:hypothetical protein
MIKFENVTLAQDYRSWCGRRASLREKDGTFVQTLGYCRKNIRI